MKPGFSLVILAVLLASPPPAAAKPAERAAAEKVAPDAAAGERAGAKKGSARKRSPKAKEQETPAISPAARSRARRTKSVFIYAAESCQRAPNTCDTTLREDAEQRFLEACGACNTFQRCEAERDAIAAGTARASQDPCAP